MRIKSLKNRSIVAALAGTVAFFCPNLASPQGNVPRVSGTGGLATEAEVLVNLRGLQAPDLLAALAVSDPRNAQRIARELSAIWDRSGSPSMDLLLRRGRAALERGEAAVALDHLTALTDHAPGFARGWSERARAFAVTGRFGPAAADLERALALNPQDYDAIFALGQMWEFFENPHKAHVAYGRAKAIHPHHEAVTKALNRLSEEALGKPL
jgi:tetratricopeptide (TPR) repeat protein